MLVALLLSAALVAPPQDYHADGVALSGPGDPRLTSFDETMKAFLVENRVPGAALAISREGRLIYARGFGFADVRRNEFVQPDSIFRIASVSKPVTSATILLLVQEGRLGLDDSVLLHLDPSLFAGRVPSDPRWADVTIRHLLHHRGGFDRESSGDPMFVGPRIGSDLGPRSTGLSAREIVRHMLRSPLDHDPGAVYSYSNFGYCLLGRVIERTTGEDYEEAVQRLLLEPLDVTSMRVGASREADRAQGEVSYHTGHEPALRRFGASRGTTRGAYGEWDHQALDAVGGWISTAPDLLRFLHLFDGPPEKRLLEEDTLALMLSQPPGVKRGPKGARWYGMGWLVYEPPGERPPNIWHNGSLPGTETLLVRRSGGVSWAVLFNARYDQEGNRLSDEIDPLLHEAAKQVRVWPEFDLFPDDDR